MDRKTLCHSLFHSIDCSNILSLKAFANLMELLYMYSKLPFQYRASHHHQVAANDLKIRRYLHLLEHLSASPTASYNICSVLWKNRSTHNRRIHLNINNIRENRIARTYSPSSIICTLNQCIRSKSLHMCTLNI